MKEFWEVCDIMDFLPLLRKYYLCVQFHFCKNNSNDGIYSVLYIFSKGTSKEGAYQIFNSDYINWANLWIVMHRTSTFNSIETNALLVEKVHNVRY